MTNNLPGTSGKDSDPTGRLQSMRQAPDADAPTLSPEIVSAASTRRAPRLVNHGRVTRAGASALAVGAAVAVGSLIVVPPSGPTSPLFAAAAGGTASATSEAAGLSDDIRIAPWVLYDYVAGEALSTEGGTGTVYELRRVGEPQQVLASLADQFGIDGDVQRTSYFDAVMPSFVVGPEDSTAPSITLTWSGTGNWWYNNPLAYPEPVCALVNYETENGTEAFEECVQPEIAMTDSLAPNESDARTQATELFAALGFDVDADAVRVTADQWQTMATANLRVDGVATAIDYSISWSPLGEIAWAYGHSIEVVDRGAFDTISAANAVERLDDWRWSGAAGPDYQGGMNILAAESGDARDAGQGALSPDTSASSPVDPIAEPMPLPELEPAPQPMPLPEPQPMPEPQPIPAPELVTVTVDKADATLLLMWDVDGNAWLVPGYAMQQPEGWWSATVSLIEGVIELPAPFEGDVTPYRED
jgi:hypothetical protein